MEQEPPCLNVPLTWCATTWARWIVWTALPGAYRRAPDFSYEPVLVSGVDVATSPGFSLTYHVRPGAVWSDGVPVSADDLVFTWQTIMNPDNDIGSRIGYDGITSAVKLDAKTAKFSFAAPYAAWKSLFSTVLPERALQGRDFDTVWADSITDPGTQEPIGAGPFLVTSWVKGQSLTLTRNPRWSWAHRPHVDSIVLKLIPDTNGEINALLGGEVDVLYPSAQTAFSVLVNHAGIGEQSSDGSLMEHLDFNVAAGTQALLHQQWFRQAVAYGIDRAAIATAIYGTIDPAIQPAQRE